LPLADTVVWTTPRCTVASRTSVFDFALGGPSSSMPTAIAAAHAAIKTITGSGLVRRPLDSTRESNKPLLPPS
jgi:hypothetical protein